MKITFEIKAVFVITSMTNLVAITNSNAYQSVKPQHQTLSCMMKWMNKYLYQKYFLLWWLPSLIKLGNLKADALTKYCFQELSNDLCCQWWLLRNVRWSLIYFQLPKIYKSLAHLIPEYIFIQSRYIFILSTSIIIR